MKEQDQNWQERERQLEKLRRRLHPLTGNAILRDVIATLVLIGSVSWFYTSDFYSSDHGDSHRGTYFVFVTALQIIGLIYLIMIWINHWLNGASIREMEKNLSAGELLEMFEKERKKVGNSIIFLMIGFLIFGAAYLIGLIAPPYGLGLMLAGVGFSCLAVSFFLYWHYKRSESMARQILQEQ
ncbi:MAG: hypothetical protein ISN29_04365 [Gammaproteobacteria bacterium AqS3]|nr:hypothetical protein [Gammaproteobacteria bacterium AqS3]